MKLSLSSATRLAASLLCAAGLAAPAHASYSYYLSFTGITNGTVPSTDTIDIGGSSTSVSNLHLIGVDSWSWGAKAATTAGTGAGAGKASASSFDWSQQIGANTVSEYNDLLSDHLISKATLYVVQDSATGKASDANSIGSVVFEMNFKNAVISSLDLSGSNGSASEDGVFSAQAVTLQYWQPSTKGVASTPIVGTWDLTTGAFSGSALALEGLALEPDAVPESTTGALALSGLGLLAWSARRKRG